MIDITKTQYPANLFRTALFKNQNGVHHYAVVDSAMHKDIHLNIQLNALDYRSLYQGQEAELLEEVAPYLVTLKENDALSRWLLENTYSHHAISFIKSTEDIDTLAIHLRKYAKIEIESTGEDGKAYKQAALFAFYDPRVFPRFVDTNSAQRNANFFQEITEYLCENTENTQQLIAYRYAQAKQSKQSGLSQTTHILQAQISEQGTENG